MSSKSQTKLFEVWNDLDPVDSWELEKNEYIQKIQGNTNSYISAVKIPLPANILVNASINSAVNFQCSTKKKYCRDMASCEEATFYLNTCGRTRLDGNRGGVACNSLCG